MPTHFFTNQGDNTLLNKFAAVFKARQDYTAFDVLVGYFYASGYFNLRPHLGGVEQIRILVGINVDTLAEQHHQRGLALLQVSDTDTQQAYLQAFKDELHQAAYALDIEQSILDFIRDISSEKIKLRAHPSRTLHAKLYILRPPDFTPHNSGEVISGSSNLTQAGLGSSHTGAAGTASAATHNYEFNVLLRDYADVKFATDEFESLWQQAVDIPPAAIDAAKKHTFLHPVTPYELYIKLLIEYFGQEIEFDPDNIQDLPPDFLRLAYQMDSVQQGLAMLEKHNGFFLADVVGLGKTIVAILIARQYFYRNNYPHHLSHTLIITPPGLQDNWRDSVAKFNLSNVAYQTIGSLHKVHAPQRYDLIIIDESHRFRNDTTEAYTHLQAICKTPTPQNRAKKVILISATPLNNRPNDLRNQLLLFQDANNSSLDENLTTYFAKISKHYRDLLSDPSPDSRAAIKTLYDQLRDKIIEPLTVRRTRQDLETHKLYKDDLAKQGIRFPHINPPQILLYPLEPDLNRLYDATLKRLTEPKDGLQYLRYRALEFLKPEHRQDYPRAEFITERLAALMRTLLVKRMDSSFYAFHKSLNRFVDATQAMLKMAAADRIILAPNRDITDDILDDKADELIGKLLATELTDPSFKILNRDAFAPNYFPGLKQDHQLLTDLAQQWGDIVTQNIDPKLDKFIEILTPQLLDTAHNPTQKLVIFSESRDTTEYLHTRLKPIHPKLLAVHAANRRQHQAAIKSNFDANLSAAEQRADYDLLITTEVLAEGINLHRANTILNYDTPWNATRLMQRIGRINRIGTRATQIRIFNFLPTEKVESDIGLRHKASLKLQAFHSALGEDSQIYTPDETVDSFGLFDKAPETDTELNARLEFLMEIRQLRTTSPDEFNRIKNLPLKIRNGRRPADPAHHHSTLAYLRNQQHGAFYKIGPNQAIEELGFTTAANILKCSPNTPAIPLPRDHHEQVQQALHHFHRDTQAKHTAAQNQLTELSPQSQAAIRFVRACHNLPTATPTDKHTLDHALELLQRGRFQNLPRAINKLQRNLKKTPLTPEKTVHSLIQIIQQHPEQMSFDEEPVAVFPTEQPQVVISQSYDVSGQ